MERTLKAGCHGVKAQSCGQFWHNHGVIHSTGRRGKVMQFPDARSKGFRPHGLTVCKSLNQKGKTGLSTENGRLYYYD
jgi:hypothetical protein